jgi:transposase
MEQIKRIANMASHDLGRLRETQVLEHTGSNGSQHHVVVEYTVTKKGASINGARLYSPDARYIGWWPAFNIPRNTLLNWKGMIDEGEWETRYTFETNQEYNEATEHL